MTNKNERVLALLGLSMRAGKAASGELACEGAVKSGEAFLVLLAEDASANTRKKFSNMCEFYKVPILTFGSKESLGQALGKEMRAMAAIRDEGMAREISRQILEEETPKKPERSKEKQNTGFRRAMEQKKKNREIARKNQQKTEEN